jgi:hypothetical protein
MPFSGTDAVAPGQLHSVATNNDDLSVSGEDREVLFR